MPSNTVFLAQEKYLNTARDKFVLDAVRSGSALSFHLASSFSVLNGGAVFPEFPVLIYLVGVVLVH